MTTYLDGAVTVERLGREPVDGRFRSADERGAVAWLARCRRYDFVHVIEFARAGVRRGFHAHAGHTESLYVFSGRLRMLARGAGGGETLAMELEAGDLATLGPGVAHGFEALEPAIAIALGTGEDPVGTTVAVPDLASSTE
jgi:dTDP-4-dehydrorhamnose 3,5-epimerase-like enzyme